MTSDLEQAMQELRDSLIELGQAMVRAVRDAGSIEAAFVVKETGLDGQDDDRVV